MPLSVRADVQDAEPWGRAAVHSDIREETRDEPQPVAVGTCTLRPWPSSVGTRARWSLPKSPRLLALSEPPSG